MKVLKRSTASKVAVLNGDKQTALEILAKAVGETRSRFLTDIPGQEITYMDKERQALSFLSAGSEPDPTDPDDAIRYRAIFQEVGVTADTAHQVAQVIAYMAERWRDVGSQIERQRLIAKAAIQNAADPDAIDAAVASYNAAVKDL